MNNEKDTIVVGLDIGTTKVCAIVGRLNEFGKIDVLGVGKADSDGVSRGVVVNIDRTVEAIKTAVQAAEIQSNVSIKAVYVGIAGDHIRSMQSKNIITLNNSEQEVSAQDVQRLHDEMFKIAVPPGHEIIHVLPQDYKVDNEAGIKQPVGHAGVRLEGSFHVVTAQTTAAKNIYRCVKRAGLEVIELVLEPIASSFAVLSEEEKEAGVCLVDIGGGTTDIAIFHDNIIRHTAVVPFGGNVITQDITSGIGIMKKQAEILKLKFGAALASEIGEDEEITISSIANRPPREIKRKDLANIIQARMQEIIEFVNAEIKHAGFDHKKLIGGIVITGGGSQLAHLRSLFELVTGIPTRVGFAVEHLNKGMVEEVHHPSFATGTGLLIYGLKNDLTLPNDWEPNKASIETSVQDKPGFTSKIKNWFESTFLGPID